MNTYNSLELKVIEWAEARKIIPNSTSVAQARKGLEESGELLEAAAALRVLRSNGLTHTGEYEYWRGQFKDAVGDVVVCLINACALEDVSLLDCLAGAYDEIKDRKGTMRADGVFVKEPA